MSIPKIEKASDRRRKWNEPSVNMSSSVVMPSNYLLPAGESEMASSKPNSDLVSKQESVVETEYKSCIGLPGGGENDRAVPLLHEI